MTESSRAIPNAPACDEKSIADVSFFEQCLKRVQGGQNLSESQALRMMEMIVSCTVTADQIEAYLRALAEKGESVDEIVGSAMTMRAHAVPFTACGNPIDNCGTGGDGAGTFNISTVAALVIASAGQPVVKHGNRSASGRVGSADLMEEMGINIALGPEDSRTSLERFNFAFLFAPQYHPAARSVAPIRKRLGRPSIFNLLGPLCNPAKPPYQLLGVSSLVNAEKIAHAALQLGVKRAFVITTNDGVDELTPGGANHVFVVEHDRVERTELSARDAGLPECSLVDLQGGDVQHNAAIAEAVFQGRPGAPRDVVVFNAGAALLCTGAAASLKEGCDRCTMAIDNGDAQRLMEQLRDFSSSRSAAR